MLSLPLKYFENAANTENFSHTADAFGVPSSTVSISIKKLEDRMGVQLFDRSANKIKLNEYGKCLLRAVQVSQEAFKKAKTEIADLSQNPTGEIHLLILSNRQRVTEVITRFKHIYPEISFIIRHTMPGTLSELTQFDIIVADGNISSDHFQKQFWLREEVMLAVPKNNPLYNRGAVTTEDIKSGKFISMHKGSGQRNHMDEFFEKAGTQPEISIECDDPEYVVKYLEMGMGIALIPMEAMGYRIPDFIHLLKVNEGLYRDTYIYTNKTDTNIVKVLTSMLRDS